MTQDLEEDLKPEQRARRNIDRQLIAAGWKVQNRKEMNLAVDYGVAVREFPTDNGPADYALYVGKKVIGFIEAKPEGKTLSDVEPQADKYAREVVRIVVELRRRSGSVDGQTVTGSATSMRSGFFRAARMV
jgi:type I restriction enzyme, R subunit